MWRTGMAQCCALGFGHRVSHDELHQLLVHIKLARYSPQDEQAVNILPAHDHVCFVDDAFREAKESASVDL